MEDFKLVSTPMAIGCHLGKDNESPRVDQTLYRSIGGLLYLIVSRPNIMHAICLVSIYQANPNKSHEKNV